MSQAGSTAARLKMLERRRLMLIERSGAERLRLCAGLHAALEPRRPRGAVLGTVAGVLLRHAVRALPLSAGATPGPLLVRLTMGAWLAYRTFTALRAGFKR